MRSVLRLVMAIMFSVASAQRSAAQEPAPAEDMLVDSGGHKLNVR